MAARRSKEEIIKELEAKILKLKEQAVTKKEVKITKDSAGIADAVSAIENAAAQNKISVSEVINAHSTGFGHPFQHDPATCSTHIRPGQSERSDARIAG